MDAPELEQQLQLLQRRVLLQLRFLEGGREQGGQRLLEMRGEEQERDDIGQNLAGLHVGQGRAAHLDGLGELGLGPALSSARPADAAAQFEGEGGREFGLGGQRIEHGNFLRKAS